MKKKLVTAVLAAAVLLASPIAVNAAPAMPLPVADYTHNGCKFRVTGGVGSPTMSWAQSMQLNQQMAVQARVSRYISAQPTTTIGPLLGGRSYVTALGGTAAGEHGRAFCDTYSAWLRP